MSIPCSKVFDLKCFDIVNCMTFMCLCLFWVFCWIFLHNRTETVINRPSYKSTMRLTISYVQKHDYGMYKCVAKNPRGETDGTIRLYCKYSRCEVEHFFYALCMRFIWVVEMAWIQSKNSVPSEISRNCWVFVTIKLGFYINKHCIQALKSAIIHESTRFEMKHVTRKGS